MFMRKMRKVERDMLVAWFLSFHAGAQVAF